MKLQRNALSVLEHPTGLEEDDEDSEDLVPYRTHIGSFLLHICTDLVFMSSLYGVNACLHFLFLAT